MSRELENLGWKAFKKGFFTQWQELCLKEKMKDPHQDTYSYYRKAYKKLNKKLKVQKQY
jgi:hypothetical protein